jgi:transposase
MFIRRRAVPGTSKVKFQICENRREGTKVRQVIVRHVGIAHKESEWPMFEFTAQAALEELIKEKNGGSLFDATEVQQDYVDRNEGLLNTKIHIPARKSSSSQVNVDKLREVKRVYDGPETIFGYAAQRSGLLDVVPAEKQVLLKNLIAQRISEPGSKKKTYENLLNRAGFECSLQSIYRMLDLLSDKERELSRLAFKERANLFSSHLDVMFFDVTTLYFESWNQDELKDFGYSKDCKFGQVQVTLALASDSNGFPVGYRLFPGNTAEISTLIQCVQEWKEILPIDRTIFVADRGMFSAKNLDKINKAGLEFIVGCPLRKLSSSEKSKVISWKNSVQSAVDKTFRFSHHVSYREKDDSGNWISHEVQGRVICLFSQKRADKDKSDRDKMIEKTRKKFSNRAKLTATKVKELIGNKGYSKYLKVTDLDEANIQIDEEKVIDEAQWDGLSGVFTNTHLMDEEVISRYRGLWRIEECFRLTKSNLKVRPIFHFTPKRIRGHVALCFMSLVTLKKVTEEVQSEAPGTSPAKIVDEVNQMGYSLIEDTKTQKRYRLPSKLTDLGRAIHKALGLVRLTKPQRV